MNAPPVLSLDVDATNPGQFLACCGLLELASRLEDQVQGWFDDRQFHLAGADPRLLEKFVECSVRAVATNATEEDEPQESDDEEEPNEPKSPPVVLGDPFNLRLDWWQDEAATEAGFKTWSAGMTVLGLFNGGITGKGKRPTPSPGMRDHMARHLRAGRRLLQETEVITKPLPFNFDSRIARNTAIDLGFVREARFAFSPAVELLAIVGLQRFRPRMEVRWDRNTYCTWRDPLPVTVAGAAAHGLIPALVLTRYTFAVKPRDAQGRYKAFGPALPQRRPNVRDPGEV